MNLWLYIPAFAALLGGTSIFVLCPTLRRFHKFMGFTFIFEGLVSLLDWSVLSGTDSFYLTPYILYISMLLVLPALYYLAVQSLLREDKFHGRDIWMLQTALVFIVLYIPVASGILPADREIFFRLQQGYAVTPTTGASALIALDRTAYALYLAEYLFIQIFCTVNLSGYIRTLENYYSDLDGRAFFPVVATLSLMGLRLIFLAVSGFIPAGMVPAWLPVVQTVVSVLFYATVVWCVCHTGYTAEELGKMAEAQAERTRTPMANDVIEARLKKLEEDKFFLDGGVNLIDVATRIGVNSKYVSEYLRFHYGETFMSYVNRLRIKHSTEYLDNKSMSMEEVSDRAGYANVSTYYRNFTKVMGISPSKYRETVR